VGTDWNTGLQIEEGCVIIRLPVTEDLRLGVLLVVMRDENTRRAIDCGQMKPFGPIALNFATSAGQAQRLMKIADAFLCRFTTARRRRVEMAAVIERPLFEREARQWLGRCTSVAQVLKREGAR